MVSRVAFANNRSVFINNCQPTRAESVASNLGKKKKKNQEVVPKEKVPSYHSAYPATVKD